MSHLIATGMSILQNGKIPRFLTEEVLQETFSSAAPPPCIAYLRKGLSQLGIYQVEKKKFIYLVYENY